MKINASKAKPILIPISIFVFIVLLFSVGINTGLIHLNMKELDMSGETFTAYTTTQLFAQGLQVGVGNIGKRTAKLWISLEKESEPPTMFRVQTWQTIKYKGYMIHVLKIGENSRGRYVVLRVSKQ